MSQASQRSLLLGLWMTALFWSFAHAGGYGHAAILGLTPLLLSAADLWRRWPVRLLHWVAVLYAELSLSWNSWASLHWVRIIIGGAIHTLLALPFQQWNQLDAHLAAPLLLLGGFVGWLLFRQCQRYSQALLLLALGALVIPINRVLWRLPAEVALASYMAIGLMVLIYFHRQALAKDAFHLPRRRIEYPIWASAALLPLMVGWQMPPHHSYDPLGILQGQVLPGIFAVGAATTGYGPGVTQIGHSLVASEAPVFLAQSPEPYYWQAAVYNTFEGTAWSNRGPTTIFLSSPSNNGIPLIQPYFGNGTSIWSVNILIAALSTVQFNTLFYTGTPTSFSVPITVHTRSERFAASNVTQYQVTTEVPVYSHTALVDAPFSTPLAGLAQDLEMPLNLSPKVSRLARKITAHASGPWAAAEDIKHYLDTHYRYSYKVTPTRNDVVNHFLFVDHQGYCDQFSTTFIMMMRSLRIPARWVVGYSSGTYDPSRNGYLVRAVDAHSWAEFWMAGVGWVPFDPTPGFSAPIITKIPAGGHAAPATLASKPQVIKHPTTPNAPALPLTPHGSGSHGHGAHTKAKNRPPVWGATIIAVIGLATLTLVLRKRLARQSLVEKLWSGLQAIARRRLGTPLKQKSPRQWGLDWLRDFPDDRDLIWPIVGLLEAAFYRESELATEEQQELVQLCNQLKQRAHSGQHKGFKDRRRPILG